MGSLPAFLVPGCTRPLLRHQAGERTDLLQGGFFLHSTPLSCYSRRRTNARPDPTEAEHPSPIGPSVSEGRALFYDSSARPGLFLSGPPFFWPKLHPADWARASLAQDGRWGKCHPAIGVDPSSKLRDTPLPGSMAPGLTMRLPAPRCARRGVTPWALSRPCDKP